MKFKVIEEFKDKYRQKRYYPGDVYESDDKKRIDFLKDLGKLGEDVSPPPKKSPKKKTKK